MAGGDETKGPDLKEGIASKALAEGAMLEGHADGEPVLLARVDGDVFAIGAKCTHYGGPLVKGLLSDGTVRCPWHHACFSLRTGEALLAPALVDAERWDVEEKDGRVRVIAKRAAPALLEGARARGRRPARAPSSVLIVGGGGAGNAAAESLRREGYGGPVRIIDPDPDAPYDRPNLSKDYLAGNAPEEWIPLHPDAFYEENGIERVRRSVASLDVNGRTVTLDDGASLPYDALILAPGAEPVHLELPTTDGARVHYLRSLADCRAIIASAESAERAVVIGASFIGLEAASALRQRKLEVHVVAPESLPLERVMGRELGTFVRELHEQHGVAFHLGRTARHIDDDGVTLDDGERIEADLVVIGVGVRPRVSLAQAAGLAVDNGILVDDRLATEAPGVFAAGDVARFPDPRTGERIRIEHWAVAQRMGRVAAQNALGVNVRFASAPFFWSRHYRVSIAYVGHAGRWDDVEVDGEPAKKDCAVWFLRDGKRVALATLGRSAESLTAEMAWEREAAG